MSYELSKPIEKAACLAMTVRVIAYLAGQGQTMGHRRSKAVVRPPSPRVLVVEIGKLYLFVPAEDVLATKHHRHSVTVGRHLWFFFICHNGSPTKKSWLAKTKS